MSVCPSIHQSIYLPTYLPTYLSLSVHPYTSHPKASLVLYCVF